MLKYLIILLDDTAVSFCHYPTRDAGRRIMPAETLRKGIHFAMKENLCVQFVYPEYELPTEHAELIESIDHTKIVPATSPAAASADVIVANSWEEAEAVCRNATKTYVLRTTKGDFMAHHGCLERILPRMARLNVILTDINTFTEADFRAYRNALEAVAEGVERIYTAGGAPQLNLLTDRMMLEAMNNCGAGDTALTLAPDGRFYVCPAFYAEGDGECTGSLEKGVRLPNAQLYRLDHAPLCRTCDAWQCRRCVWMNRRTTLEVNTPGHEQCVAAHIERNTARRLLKAIRRHGTFLPEREEIKEIDYLDPFEAREEW